MAELTDIAAPIPLLSHAIHIVGLNVKGKQQGEEERVCVCACVRAFLYVRVCVCARGSLPLHLFAAFAALALLIFESTSLPRSRPRALSPCLPPPPSLSLFFSHSVPKTNSTAPLYR